jgi:hypothetical protein
VQLKKQMLKGLFGGPEYVQFCVGVSASARKRRITTGDQFTHLVRLLTVLAASSGSDVVQCKNQVLKGLFGGPEYVQFCVGVAASARKRRITTGDQFTHLVRLLTAITASNRPWCSAVQESSAQRSFWGA